MKPVSVPAYPTGTDSKKQEEMQKIFSLLYFTFFVTTVHSQQKTYSEEISKLMQSKDDKIAMQSILRELEKIDEVEIDDFANTFVRLCTAQKREYLKNQVVMCLYDASLPKYPTGELLEELRRIGVLEGEQAPDFTLTVDKKLSDVLSLQNWTLLFFYDRSCGICQDELSRLKAEYRRLDMDGILLISIDCNVKKTTTEFWQYNVANEMGERYIPYGVLKTPTYILIDNQGIVRGRYPQLSMILREKFS